MSDRVPRFLVPDNTPLSLLALVGPEALDWIFVPGVEVCVTDMVRAEALREPDPGSDPRRAQRAVLRDWFNANDNRIRVVPTPEGADYAREMRNWVKAGSAPEDKPSWRNRGERSIRELIPVVEDMVAEGEALIVLMDDRTGRLLMSDALLAKRMDADIMSTETFLSMVERDYGCRDAGTAWIAISIASAGRQPDAPDEDPTYVRGR